MAEEKKDNSRVGGNPKAPRRTDLDDGSDTRRDGKEGTPGAGH